MSRVSCFVVTTLFLSACSGSDDLVGEGPAQLDVSGVWTATLGGTVFQDEDGTGRTTFLKFTLVQSGPVVSGSHTFTD
jgi:hypothetical protein